MEKVLLKIHFLDGFPIEYIVFPMLLDEIQIILTPPHEKR